ncbi:MAG: 2-C-methyl-D-erythritol 4-phosphate cytidylyltransferase [Lachnospiraceae bacterium]|nr:2-C-methyl-D-erythritol 4-phosphate cytidylyltransferase [Lachnospiraceae bacterium]
MKNVAIVLAAGQGKRMNSKVQKQFLLIKEKPVLYYTLRAFENSELITDVILVTGKDEIEYCQKEIVEKYGFEKVRKIVAGGKERYHSVHNGIQAIDEAEYVFIHDGARPFVNNEMIARAYDAVAVHKACVVGMPVKDTIKIADEEGFAAQTPDRKKVWQVQTPQTFEYHLIKEAYEKLMIEEPEGITDDAMVVETMTNYKVKLVEGSYRNIKITTPEDLDIATIFCGLE